MWVTHTVRRVAEAVVALLCDPLSDGAHRKLAKFRLQEWKASYHWLDANGLALYFRSAVRANQLDNGLPHEVLRRLDQNYTDNQARLEHQFVEFRTINQQLQEAGIRYVNLKGFTLEPAYCPDLSLRYQCDLDFMVRRADRHSCRAVLKELGYRVTSDTPEALELKPPEHRIPHIEDLYRPRKQQSVEVHFGGSPRKLDLREDCLDQAIFMERSGTQFPALSEVDQFFSIIFHLYRHLLSEWIRLSWFFELEWYLRQRASDNAFWTAVLHRAASERETTTALSLIIAFSRQAFTSALPASLARFCSSALGTSLQLWIVHYGPEMLFSDFPGNKLYLFLARELSPHSEDWHEANRKRLLPLHGPGNALYSNSWAERIRYIPANTRYGLMRAGFHAREGIRYLSEQWRWKRRVGHTALLEPGSE